MSAIRARPPRVPAQQFARTEPAKGSGAPVGPDGELDEPAEKPKRDERSGHKHDNTRTGNRSAKTRDPRTGTRCDPETKILYRSAEDTDRR